jgi:hypothetical protein
MHAIQPENSATKLPGASRALDEFAVEQAEPAVAASGSLLDFAPAEVSASTSSEPLSRIDAAEARRQNRRVSLRERLAAFVSHRTAASHARMVAERDALQRLTRHVSLAIGHTRVELVRRSSEVAVHTRRARMFGSRMWTIASQAFARPSTDTSLDHQEFNGFVVAVALGVAVIGYGALLAVFWRHPVDARVARATVPRYVGDTQPVTAPAMLVTGARSTVRPVEANRPLVVSTIATVERPAAFRPTTRTLNALWQRRDTRSLDRAFATLRRETLAFRSCGVRMTDADRAVARCDGVAIDFHRTAGRWQIARVTTR